jgi:alpha-L-fucosidase
LNVPPNSSGLISVNDSASLIGFKKLKDESFRENLLKQANTFYEFSPQDLNFRNLGDGAFGANLQNFVVQLPGQSKINCLVLREAIHLGQTVRKFRVLFYNKDKMIRAISGTTVGRKRILTFPAMSITSFKVYLDDAQGSDNISGIAAYLIDDKLVEK